MTAQVHLPLDQIADFCERWRIKEMAVFGSALAGTARPDSDVDLLVVFHDDAEWDLFDYVRAESELRLILGRDVDLVEKQNIKNPFFRHHVMQKHKVICAATGS